MPTASELTAEFSKKTDELNAFLDGAKWESPPTEQLEKLRELNATLNDIGKKRDVAAEVEGIASHARELKTELAKPVGRPFSGQSALEDAKSLRSFGDAICSVLFTKSGGVVKGQDLEVKDYTFGEFKASPRGVDAEYKTTMTTTGGWTPEARRSGRVELSLQNPLTIVDILPTIPVSMGTYTYMKETTFTNLSLIHI